MQMLSVTGSLFIAAVLSHKSEIRSFADVTHEALTFTISLSVISDATPTTTDCMQLTEEKSKVTEHIHYIQYKQTKNI